MLTAEFESAQLLSAQYAPQRGFCGCQMLPQLTLYRTPVGAVMKSVWRVAEWGHRVSEDYRV